jgi:hypothetical protein
MKNPLQSLPATIVLGIILTIIMLLLVTAIGNGGA